MRYLTLAALVVAVLALGCQVPVDNTPKNSGGTTLDLTKPGQVLKSIQIGAVTLPKSLQDGSTNAGARSLKSASRAIGEVSTLTSLNLPSLKASGYNQFKTTVTAPPQVQMFIDGLKTSKAVTEGTLAVGTTTDLGDITMLMPQGGSIVIPNAGKIKAELSGDGNALSVYWGMQYPNQTLYYANQAKYTSLQDFFNRGPRVTIDLYFLINKGGTVQMWAQSDVMAMKYWTKYDPSTKESIAVCDNGGGTLKSVNLVQPQPDGSFFIYNSYTGLDNEGQPNSNDMLGYANDSYGGIVTQGSGTYDNGSGTVAPHPYLNVEYYDGNGDLVYQGYGNSGADASQWSWMQAQSAYSFNIHDVVSTKPDNGFKVRTSQIYVWHSDTQMSTNTTTYEISFDEGTSWQTITPPTTFWGNYVFHDPKSDSGSWSIQPGDAQYYTSLWTSTPGVSVIDGSNYTWTWSNEVTYYKGFEVPTPETYFGTPYYVSKNFPLKNLLPLTGKYKEGFEVRQKEQETWWGWEAPDGHWQNAQTEPAKTAGGYDPLVVKAGTVPNKWTNYTYWLENTAYADPTGKLANDRDVIDTDKGDVQLNNLMNMSVWYWDSNTQQSLTMQSPAFYTYSGDLPPYFTVDQNKINAVDSTKAKLETYYANRGTYSVDQYLMGFDDLMKGIADKFADLVP